LSSEDIAEGAILRGIMAYQEAHPYLRVEFCLVDVRTPHPGQKLREHLAVVRPNGVLASLFWHEPRHDFLCPGRPLVNVGDYHQTSFPTVMVDQAYIGEHAAEHLMKLELPNYAFISLTGRGYGVRMRWRGFRNRLARAGHTCLLFDSDYPKTAQQLDEEDIKEWVERLPKPIGIHAVYLSLALRVSWACRSLGVRIPEDVSLIGGQDFPMVAEAWTPTISSLSVNRAVVGYKAMHLLDRLLHDGKKPPTTPTLVRDIVVMPRQSSDVLATRDPAVARVRKIIVEQANHPMVIKELLEHTSFSFSRRTLERRFERQMGHSLHDEIVAARMAIAERLLRQTLLRPTEVARQTGYASYRVFATAFKKQHAGLTATSFRRQHMATVPAGLALHNPHK